MDGVLPKEQQELIEKICIYIVNRYQTTNSCDIITNLIYEIAEEMLGDEFTCSMLTANGIIEITDEEGQKTSIAHSYDYTFYKDNPFGDCKNNDAVVIIDSAINQFKYINSKIPNYLISNLKDMPEFIKYIPMMAIDYEHKIRFKDEQIKVIADYILNNPKEELRNIDEKDKQDLYINRNLLKTMEVGE